VKIQHAGQRRTYRLAARSRPAAAREALDLFVRLTTDAEGGRAVSRRMPTPAARPRLLVRPHPPSTKAPDRPEFSAHIEHTGRHHYFPLGTADSMAATKLARRLQQVVQRHGITEAHARFPRELTLAFRWTANPMAWTYFTLHTCPSPATEGKGSSAGRRQARAWPVAVVEPDLGLRQALTTCAGEQAGFSCVAGFAEAGEALLWLARNPVALLLVNHTLADGSGSGFLERLRRLAPNVPGLLYSVYDDSDQLFRSTPGGAIGYLLRRTPTDRIFEPLAGNAADGWPTPARITQRVLGYFQQLIGSRVPEGGSLEMARLTPRELEILGLLSKGFLDKEIAHALQISAWTVHGHAKNIYEKLGVHTRTEAVVKYLQR
jgi:DNA-binding NarL/FixJ family response regulator